MASIPGKFLLPGRKRTPVQRLEFIVIGAQKCGTTALNYYLKRHRQIVLPAKKELHFFDHDALFADNEVNYDQLHAMFPPARPGTIVGENTPNYIYSPVALPRIHAYNPAIKLIALLRNPVERAFSQWNMQRVRGIEPLDFVDAIRVEPERLTSLPKEQRRKFAYLDRGRYSGPLARLFELFSAQQAFILKYETFRAKQCESVAEVFRFLSLDPPRFRHIEAHDIAYARKIRPDERAFVADLVREDVKRVEQLLNWNCSDWF